MDAVAFDLLFVFIVAAIVALGVQDGLERAAKVMIPSVVGLLLVLAVYGATLSGAGEGYEYYLSPNLDTLATDAISILPAAAGQAFFTLSLGMGIMITYGSYLDEDRSLLRDSLLIIVADTFIAILSGLVVFPILFARGVDPGTGGIGTTFVGLAGAFAELPGGEYIGAIFFLMLLLAALTSAFSILEVVVSFVIDTFDLRREYATAGSVALIFLVGIPTALDLDYLTVYDAVANKVLLILGGLLLAIFAGWVYSEGAMTELRKGLGDAETLPTVWIWILRVPVIIVLAYVLYQNGVDVIETVRTTLL